MNYWFTSDTHWHHANVIKYCNRPFKDVVEMNETMISNWNSVVSRGDLVYHLGDFCFGDEDYHFNMIFNRLQGTIIFIKGNHDKLAWKMRSAFYASYDSYHEIKIEGQAITLCHYKMAIWNKSHKGAWHLYGHSHGSAPNEETSLSFDVGVDCHNFTPVSFEKVSELMNKKTFKPVDHHGDRQKKMRKTVD